MPRRERLILALILGAYLVLAVAFSLGPIFEGPDEIEHYRFVRTLVQTRTLPDPYTQVRAQYHQAPLYYFLAAPFPPRTVWSHMNWMESRYRVMACEMASRPLIGGP